MEYSFAGPGPIPQGAAVLNTRFFMIVHRYGDNDCGVGLPADVVILGDTAANINGYHGAAPPRPIGQLPMPDPPRRAGLGDLDSMGQYIVDP